MRDHWFRPDGSTRASRSSGLLAGMITLLLLATAPLCFAPGAAEAAPRILEPDPLVLPPIPEQFPYPSDVALDGDRLAVATFQNQNLRNVYVYERSAQGSWGAPTLVISASGPYHAIPVHIALQGNLLAMTFHNQLQIAERSASGWRQTAVLNTPPGIRQMGTDVDIDGDTIVVSAVSTRAHALIFRRNAAGVWQYNGAVDGEPFDHETYDYFFGGDVDISGDTIVVGSTGYVTADNAPYARAFVYRNNNGTWVQSAVLGYPLQQPEPFGFARRVAIEGDTLILAEEVTLHMYRRSGATWSYVSSVRPPQVAIGPQGPSPAISGNLVVQATGGGSDPESMYVYQRDGTQLQLVAKLVGSYSRFDLSGRTAIGAEGSNLRLFQVPEGPSLPPLRQDDFQDGNAAGWTPFPATSWNVVASGSTSVYRQSNLASEARAVLTGTQSPQQSVQADITPTAFNGNDRWFGLATRYIDSSNYYYATVRSSNTAWIRKMVNGVFQTLATRTLSITPGQTYRVRLEAIGSQIRLLIDDVPSLVAVDTDLSHGQAALLTYRTQADFDNVLVSSSALLPLFADSFHVSPPPDALPSPSIWVETGTGVWGHPPEVPSDPDFPDDYAHLRNYRQTSINGGARSHVGVSTDNQTVQTRVVPTAMAGTGWFGVMARYIDDGNYYYLKVGNGEASLRKLVDGGIFELARAPFTPGVNTWYTLRLEVVGTSLRAYIDDRFLLEATDSSHPAGKYGVVTYRASATFDNFSVTQP